ncbi:MAG TPA: hypothetical protein VHK69_15510 [Chitinophagaceae bacterium]|jgi:hypothetical protein|nr:hypothetical protein [Chitinophagaceae bacterium]
MKKRSVVFLLLELLGAGLYLGCRYGTEAPDFIKDRDATHLLASGHPAGPHRFEMTRPAPAAAAIYPAHP